MSSPTSIADPTSPTALLDLRNVTDDKENNNAVEDVNQKTTSTSLLDARKEEETCASFYTEESDSKKVLLAMAYGIKLGDHNIGDCEVEPYASSKGKNYFVPVVPHLIKEIQRRCASQKITPVKCKNYNKPKLLTWLSNNPIVDPADVAFLVKEEALFRKVPTDSMQEKENNNLMTNKETIKTIKKPWNQNGPFLRLYHCLLEDNVRKAFIKNDEALTHQQLDANKSSKRSPNWQELARDRFNDCRG